MQYIIQNVDIFILLGARIFFTKAICAYDRHTHIQQTQDTIQIHRCVYLFHEYTCCIYLYNIKVSLYTRMDRKFEFFTRFSVKIFKSCNFFFVLFKIVYCFLKRRVLYHNRVGTIKFCSLFQVNNGKTFYYPDIHFALTLLI